MGIADIAALVTVTGVAIYVLGLIGLAIPILRVFTDEISTAWYAASLAPKTIVAGQGVRIWILWTSVNAAVLLLFTAGLQLLPYSAPSTEITIFMVGLTFVAAILPLVVGMRDVAKTPVATVVGRVGRYSKVISKVQACSTFIGVFLAVYAFYLFNPEVLGPQITEWFRTLVPTQGFLWGDDSYVLRASLALLIPSFFLGVRTAIGADPPLPKVRITTQTGTTPEDVLDPLEGWLVAHSDGFWHLFIVAAEQSELLSIPDDKVLAVRMLAESTRVES